MTKIVVGYGEMMIHVGSSTDHGQLIIRDLAGRSMAPVHVAARALESHDARSGGLFTIETGVPHSRLTDYRTLTPQEM